jgi:hypothetical protein
MKTPMIGYLPGQMKKNGVSEGCKNLGATIVNKESDKDRFVLTEGNPRVVSPLASNGLDELHVSIY